MTVALMVPPAQVGLRLRGQFGQAPARLAEGLRSDELAWSEVELAGHGGIANVPQTIDPAQVDARFGQMIPRTERTIHIPGQEAAAGQ